MMQFEDLTASKKARELTNGIHWIYKASRSKMISDCSINFSRSSFCNDKLGRRF
jgi:hypothetical protein